MDDNTLLFFEDTPETEESTPVYEYDKPEESNTETEAETETEADAETSDGPSDSSGEDINEELTDRLDALIEILTPEESEESETGYGEDESAEHVISADDAYIQELLENVNGTLVAIKWDNISYYSEMLAYQEQMAAHQEHMAECFEYSLIAIFFIGFFVAFSCGCRLADTFFNRMRG